MDKQPHPKDVEVGGRIRLYRKAKGLSQSKLAKEVGVSWQAIQKYEAGVNRVGSSRLFDIAIALGIRSSELLIDNQIGNSGETVSSQIIPDKMMSKEGIQLHIAYFAIKDPKVRSCLLSAIEHVASGLSK